RQRPAPGRLARRPMVPLATTPPSPRPLVPTNAPGSAANPNSPRSNHEMRLPYSVTSTFRGSVTPVSFRRFLRCSGGEEFEQFWSERFGGHVVSLAIQHAVKPRPGAACAVPAIIETRVGHTWTRRYHR